MNVEMAGTKKLTRSQSLAARLVGGIVLINIFVYFLVGYSLYQNHQQCLSRATVSTQNLAKTLEIGTLGVLSKIDATLFAVVKETERQLRDGGIDALSLNQYLSGQYSQVPELSAIWVTDAAGNIRYGTSELPPGTPVNIGDREYFSRLLQNPGSGLVISKPLVGRIIKQWSILACKRINNPDGSFGGVAFGALKFVDYFSNVFSRIDIGRRGMIALRDQDLGMLVQFPASSLKRAQIGSKVVSGKTLEMLRKNPETGSYTTVAKFDNVERAVSYRKIGAYPFYLFVAQSKQDFLSPWKKEAATSLALLASFTLFTIITGRMYHKRTQEVIRVQALERHREELEAEVERRKQKEVELKDKNVELERFTYTVSHDLKSPLITIKGYVGALEQDLRSGNYAHMSGDLQRIGRAADLMNSMLQDLLELSRIGRVITPPQQVPLHELVQEVLAHLAGLLKDCGAEVLVQDDLPTVLCDRQRIAQVLQNLVENAVKYRMPQPAPRIVIGMREAEGRPVLFVKDNGMGIEREHHQKIFGLFCQLDAKREGTGIGLALVKRIIEVHGGKVWVESEGVGSGSTFCFTITPPSSFAE